MQMSVAVKCHLTLDLRRPSKIPPPPAAALPLFRGNLASKLSLGALSAGTLGRHIFCFLLISLENLVKIRGDSDELVAQIPHCFHSCLARRTKAGGFGGVWAGRGGRQPLRSSHV